MSPGESRAAFRGESRAAPYGETSATSDGETSDRETGHGETGHGRAGRRWGLPFGKPKEDGEIWPEESVWEVHRPWPLDDSSPDDLPPSARWYGTPTAPPPRRAPGRLRRLTFGLVAAVVGVGAGFAVAVLVPRIVLGRAPSAWASAPQPARVNDLGAGVGYPLPEGWRVGTAPSVTGFTSAGGDGAATVMTGPAEPVTDVAGRAIDLADLYGRLLLHGDEVEVVDDRTVTVGGRSGHSRSLRAEYRDVVNRPAYLRVVLLAGSGTRRPVVVIGMAQPDDPRLRAVIDKVISEVR